MHTKPLAQQKQSVQYVNFTSETLLGIQDYLGALTHTSHCSSLAARNNTNYLYYTNKIMMPLNAAKRKLQDRIKH